MEDKNEETKAILGELEFYLKTHKNLPIEERKRDRLDGCKHFQVVVDEESHTVICRQCHKKLDPFWYLILLAREWKFRRYTDSEAIAAYRALRQKQLNDEARGKIISRPKEGEGQEVWDDFTKWQQREPIYIYKQGRREWMVEDREVIDGVEHRVAYGHCYIKMMLAGKKL